MILSERPDDETLHRTDISASVLCGMVGTALADGMSNDEILSEHPDLEPGDISEALHYAAMAVRERELPLRLPA